MRSHHHVRLGVGWESARLLKSAAIASSAALASVLVAPSASSRHWRSIRRNSFRIALLLTAATPESRRFCPLSLNQPAKPCVTGNWYQVGRGEIGSTKLDKTLSADDGDKKEFV